MEFETYTIGRTPSDQVEVNNYQTLSDMTDLSNSNSNRFDDDNNSAAKQYEFNEYKDKRISNLETFSENSPDILSHKANSKHFAWNIENDINFLRRFYGNIDLKCIDTFQKQKFDTKNHQNIENLLERYNKDLWNQKFNNETSEQIGLPRWGDKLISKNNIVCSICKINFANIACNNCADYFCFGCAYEEHSLKNSNGDKTCENNDQANKHFKDYPNEKSRITPLNHIWQFLPQKFYRGGEKNKSQMDDKVVEAISTLDLNTPIIKFNNCDADENFKKIPNQIMCNYHENEPIRYFCLTCQECECICADCIIINKSHKNHDVQLVKDAFESIKSKELYMWNMSIEECMADIDTIREIVDEKRFEWISKLHDIDIYVKSTLDSIKKKLIDLKKKIIENLRNLFEDEFVKTNNDIIFYLNQELMKIKSIIDGYHAFNRTNHLCSLALLYYYNTNYQIILDAKQLVSLKNISLIPKGQNYEIELLKRSASNVLNVINNFNTLIQQK